MGDIKKRRMMFMKKNGLKKLVAGLSAVCVAASALPVFSFAADAAVSTMTDRSIFPMLL